MNHTHLDKTACYIDQFAKNDELIVVENFFEEVTFQKIQAEANRIWKTNEMEPNCNLDGRDRLTGHHLLHQRAEQVESFEKGTTFRTDGTSQLRNHRSAIHKSTATRRP